MFGLPKVPWGPWALASGTDTRPTNSVADMASLQKMLAQTRAKNGTPNGRVARGWDQFAPQTGQEAPMLPTPAPQEDAGPPPALSPQGLIGPPTPPPPAADPAVPMPMARPPEAPQAPPEMGFFQRNAAMMQDPNNPGSFIDPEAASRAQASGPDVINKLLNMFHEKANS